MIKYLLAVLLGVSPCVIHAQLLSELVSLQNKHPNDSCAFGISMWCTNFISRIEKRDYTASSDKQVLLFNPAMSLEMLYDISYNSAKKSHLFIGWNGSFYGDDVMTRLKIGIVHNTSYSFGVLLGKRIISSHEGDYFSRRGKFRHVETAGLFVEQYNDVFSMSIYCEYSKNEMYHCAEISRRLTEYPKFWIAACSESMRGYGPRIYYKMVRSPVWLQCTMNIAPPAYRDHDNVSNSFQVGFRRSFY